MAAGVRRQVGGAGEVGEQNQMTAQAAVDEIVLFRQVDDPRERAA
jgi:hypothetical protein